MTATERISLKEATDLIETAFLSRAVPEPVARSVAVALVAAEAEGQVGHGFSRVDDYLGQVRSGKIIADAQIKTKLTGTTSLLVDAGFGFAYPALDQAISTGSKLALQHGCAMIGITRSHHCGALSVQVEKLAKRGLCALMVANAPAAMAPWGGKDPVFGTNPLAFAAPGNGDDPLIIDLSLSRVARGKVMNAHKAGKPIPDNWALDQDGNPTTNAKAALDGTMLPIGEAKGTALALMVEILAAIMTGAARSTEASSFFIGDGPPPGVGQFLIAMKPFETQSFQSRLTGLLDQIAAMDGTRLPGKRRAAAIRSAHKNGIDVPLHYLTALRERAQGKV
ncbi:MAG: Ldh family oxidoreductase [Roseibium sp.]